MVAGYIQIPSTGWYVRISDASGPYYLAANGTMTPLPISIGSITWDSGATWDAGTFWS